MLKGDSTAIPEPKIQITTSKPLSS